MTFNPNSIHLLEERELGADVTDVTFSSLANRNPDHRILRLYMTIVNPTISTSDYYLVINGHVIFTDYHSNAISASNGGTNFARVNAPRIIDSVPPSPDGIFYGYTDIIYNLNFDLVRWISMNIKGNAFPIGFINYAGMYNNFFNPVNSITVHSTVVDAIGAGSKFKLFRASTI
jgi:hypothetical protein